MAQEQLEFYVDEEGTHCARGEDDRLACYLQTDIQGSAELAQTLIARLSDDDYRGEFNGNGHSVDIRENSVLIDSNLDDEAPSRLLSRVEMLETMRAWQIFITSTDGNQPT